MKIAYVCNEYPPVVERFGAPHGGIGTVVQILAEGMAARGHDVTVVGVYGESGEEITSGVRTVRLGHSSARGFRWYLDRKALLRWLQDEADRNGLDIVEAPEFAGWLMQPPRGPASVLRLHGSSFYFPIEMGPIRGRLVARLERKSLHAIHNWIGVSEFVTRRTSQLIRSESFRSLIIYNPVDTDFFQPPKNLKSVKNDKKIILHIGTVVEHKGVLSLGAAADIFLRQENKAELVFAGRQTEYGKRPMSESILKLIAPDLRRRVQFIGSVPRGDLLQWLHQAAVVVAPSFGEACPMAWLEAMSCECPIVASSASCGPEIVQDRVNGLLVDPHVPRQIANAVVALLRDPDLARELGRNARYQVTQRNSLQSVLNQTTAFYAEIMN